MEQVDLPADRNVLCLFDVDGTLTAPREVSRLWIDYWPRRDFGLVEDKNDDSCESAVLSDLVEEHLIVRLYSMSLENMDQQN